MKVPSTPGPLAKLVLDAPGDVTAAVLAIVLVVLLTDMLVVWPAIVSADVLPKEARAVIF